MNIFDKLGTVKLAYVLLKIYFYSRKNILSTNFTRLNFAWMTKKIKFTFKVLNCYVGNDKERKKH